MAIVTKENIGNLHDKLIVKVSKEDYYPLFEKAIKDYSKKVNIPGFRKGMVPPGMIKKMYGPSIFHDEVVKAVEKNIGDYLRKENPQIFAQPLPMQNDLRNLDMANPEEYDFPFEIGLKPEISLDAISSLQPVLYRVNVTDKMVNDEIEKLVTKHGNMQDADVITSEDNVLNVSFTQSDEAGNPLLDAVPNDNSILLKYFTEEYRGKLMEKSKDETIVLQLKDAFAEKEREWIFSDLGLDKNDPSATEKYFLMAITKIGLVEKRELNQEFFKEIFPGKEIANDEEFYAALRGQLQQQWDLVSKNQLHDQVYHSLIHMPVELPESFLKRWLAVSGEKAKTNEEVEAEFPSLINQLKWTLISDKLISENNIEVSQEELRNGMKAQIMQYFGQMNAGEDQQWIKSYIDRMMKDDKQVDHTYRSLLSDKMFAQLDTQIKPLEQDIAPDELLAMQHHHH